MKRTVLSMLLGCLILTASACAAIATDAPIAVPPSATATRPTSTPTIVWFPASQTPTAPAFATQAPTPERKPDVGPVVLADDFSSAKPWNPGVSEDASILLGQGQLTIATQPGVNAYRVRQGPTLTDFYAEITARPSLCRGDDEYGLLFRAPTNVAYYAFALTCNGTSHAERIRLGRPLPLHDPVASADVPLGAPGEARLGVWVGGSEMRFFLNGHYQFSVTDPTLKAGAVGVFARSVGTTPVTVTFSDLQVYIVAYIPPSATPTP